MKDLVLTLVTCCVLTLGIDAQIRWGDPSLPKECCSTYWEQGRLVAHYEDARVVWEAVLFPSEKDKKHSVVLVDVRNKGESPINVLPELFTLGGTPSIPYTEIAKAERTKGDWRYRVAGAGAGMATTRSTATVTDSKGNTSNVTIDQKDTDATSRVEANARAHHSANASRALRVDDAALKSQTVTSGQEVVGLLWFKKQKEPADLSFTIYGVTYLISLTSGGK